MNTLITTGNFYLNDYYISSRTISTYFIESLKFTSHKENAKYFDFEESEQLVQLLNELGVEVAVEIDLDKTEEIAEELYGGNNE